MMQELKYFEVVNVSLNVNTVVARFFNERVAKDLANMLDKDMNVSVREQNIRICQTIEEYLENKNYEKRLFALSKLTKVEKQLLGLEN